MENFDNHMARAEIEDALTNVDNPAGRGIATGLCGAFYMCGLLSSREWSAFMKRIPSEPHETGTGKPRGSRLRKATHMTNC